jgi:hypothetical protein
MIRRYWVRWLDSFSDNRKSEIENPKLVGIVAIGVVFALCGAVAQAQQATKIPRIGVLDGSTASGNAVRLEAFRQELSKLGWIEGKKISPSRIGLPSKSLGACLSLRRSWFVLKLILLWW